MSDEQMGSADLGSLIETVAEATSAFIGGDARRYAELMNHADDFTLMPPHGGPIARGFDSSEESIVGLERFFHRGQATLEVLQTYASGGLAVLVVVERLAAGPPPCRRLGPADHHGPRAGAGPR
jgi:hypothetical protein